MKILAIFIIACIGASSADVSHILAASIAAQSARYIPPIPNALRSAAPISNLISHGDISTAAQTQSESFVPAPVPDSATQGPNPQDIATPEPEYIDIDLPFPEPPPRPAAPAPAPRPVARAPAPRAPAPRAPAPRAQAPRFQPPPPIRPPSFFPAPSFGNGPLQNYLPPLNEPLPGHTFGDDGYRYRTPRRRYF